MTNDEIFTLMDVYTSRFIQTMKEQRKQKQEIKELLQQLDSEIKKHIEFTNSIIKSQ